MEGFNNVESLSLPGVFYRQIELLEAADSVLENLP